MVNGLNVSTDKVNELVAQRENSSELINGYTNTNGYTEPLTENKQEKSKRVKKDERCNDEFFNQIAITMQNLQRDLDRITARVRSLEGQTLQALAPSIVCVNTIKRHFYHISISFNGISFL